MVTLRADVRLNTKQELGYHSGKLSDSDCLDRPAGACHHYTHPALLNKGHSLRQLAPTIGIPTGADSQNWSRNLNLTALCAYPNAPSVCRLLGPIQIGHLSDASQECSCLAKSEVFFILSTQVYE